MQYTQPTAHELKMRKAAIARRNFLNTRLHDKQAVASYVASLNKAAK